MKGLSAVSLLAVSVTLLVLTCLTHLPVAKADTAGITSITDVQYSSQAALQNGVANVAIKFTVYYNYYYNPQGYLVFAIYTKGTSTIVNGSAAAMPDPCQSLAGTIYANSAICAIVPAMNSGTDFASFTLTFNSPQLYSLEIRSFIWDTRNFQSGNQVSGSNNAFSVTISVTGQTVSTASTTASSSAASSTATGPTTALTSTAATTSAAAGASSSISLSTNTPSEQSTSNYTEPIIVIVLIIAVAAAIILAASRRRTARPPSTEKKAATQKPSGSFCTNCGATVPEGNTFCSNCGAKKK
ncbi:MAG TPA: zinc ribbon domain-containing protein [Terriglobales bacterium]|nr:zinc ribbon domain-containing protein [Terriglobales bacterium]